MNKNAPTQRQRKERARRQAMGIALIHRPLKYIKSRTDEKSIDEITKVVTFYESSQSKQARHAATHGNGALVQRIARDLL